MSEIARNRRDDPASYDEGAERAERPSPVVRTRTTRTERRFEFGLFVRRRRKVGSKLAERTRQLAMASGQEEAPGPAPVVPIAHAAHHNPSPPPDDSDSEDGISQQGAAGEDDGGPIHGTSYEAGVFVSSTKKTTSYDVP